MKRTHSEMSRLEKPKKPVNSFVLFMQHEKAAGGASSTRKELQLRWGEMNAETKKVACLRESFLFSSTLLYALFLSCDVFGVFLPLLCGLDAWSRTVPLVPVSLSLLLPLPP